MVAPPWGVEALTDVTFFVIEERPKSARRGLPWTSMRTLGWRKPKMSAATIERLNAPLTPFRSP